MTSKVVKTSPTPLDDIVSLRRSLVMHGLVHHLTVKISIGTNGNAVWLLIQVHSFPQCGDDKEGGTKQATIGS
jgi:hypothetical protein